MYNPTKNEWDKIPSMNQVSLPVIEAASGPVLWPRRHPKCLGDCPGVRGLG